MAKKTTISDTEFFGQMQSAWNPYNATLILKIRPKVEISLLQKALDMLQKRHRFLQVSIKNWPDIEFVEQGVKKIPVYRYQANTIADYKAVVSNELMHYFEDTSQPLMRVSVISVAELDELEHILLNFHHRIGDGASIINFANELLQSYQQYIENNLTFQLPVLTERYDDMMQLLPERFFAWKSKLKRAFLFLKLGIKEARLQGKYPMRSLVDAAFVEDEKVRIGFFQKKQTNETLKKILKATKAKGVSLHGAACAALILAEYEYYRKKTKDEKSISLMCLSPVNVRNLLKIPLPAENFGQFVSGSRSRCVMNENTDFWTLARQIKEDIDENIRSEMVLHFRFFIKTIMKIALKSKKFNPAAASVSNVGRILLQPNYGAISLEGVAYYVTNKGLVQPSMAIVLSTFNDELYWDCNFPAHFLPTEDAEKIVIRAMQILNQQTQSNFYTNP